MRGLQILGGNQGKANARLTAVAGAGRFAPSPTGPLHIGSLYAALASFLDARAQGLAWRLRFDDLDQARNDPTAEARILRTLEAHGLHWDGAVQRQSQRLEHYQAALAKLRQAGLVFFCTCSRSRLRGHSIYPGRCRQRLTPVAEAAVRVRVDDAVCEFTDLALGRQRYPLGEMVGDFVVKRRDGPFAYQLATAVDDGDADIVRVLRGRDLLENTPRQLFLMDLLNRPAPAYAHIPVLLNAAKQKWSKQTLAPGVDDRQPLANLRTCLDLLGLAPPALGLQESLQWAASHWDLGRLGRRNRVFDMG